MNRPNQASAQISFSDVITQQEGDSWKEEVLSIIHTLCLHNASISADNVVEYIESQGIEKTRLSSISSLLKEAVKRGWLEYKRCRCGEECSTVESKREGNNGRRIMVYKSLL